MGALTPLHAGRDAAATDAYASSWGKFYSLQLSEKHIRLGYLAPRRPVSIPFALIDSVVTGPGYKGQRPLRLRTRDGRAYESALVSMELALERRNCLARVMRPAERSEPSGTTPVVDADCRR